MKKPLKTILVLLTCLTVFLITKAIAGFAAAFVFEYFGLLNLENIGANGLESASAQDIASMNRIKGLQVLISIAVTAGVFFTLNKKYLGNGAPKE